MTAATIPTFTEKEALATLKEVVKENPDTVYKAPFHMDPERTGSCFYVHTDLEGNPMSAGCIVGQVLHRLGVPLEVLKGAERLSAAGAFNYLGLDPDSRLAKQLSEVQFQQDQGVTWEGAYAHAFGKLR
ncbi:hypothetical protein [Streptomyces sp. NRRL S-241]|uniref:hypothetical protein n=1 Tax=Streptomyces sp. NRRL S-241 TaxID=1463896 RepID=UPI0004C16B33|nr:hypothetical protein [Streptomyces sp. NRRL S-241]